VVEAVPSTSGFCWRGLTRVVVCERTVEPGTGPNPAPRNATRNRGTLGTREPVQHTRAEAAWSSSVPRIQGSWAPFDAANSFGAGAAPSWRCGVAQSGELQASIVGAWRTNNRVTIDLIQQLPPTLWDIAVEAMPRRKVRAIAAHIHNARCRWIRTLGREHGITAATRVDHHRVTARQLAAALRLSGKGMEALLVLGLAAGGRVPPSKGYVWRNLSLDVGHVLTYFVAHEAHHRGQIIMMARQSRHRLPRATTDGLWQWKMDGTASRAGN
jgi:uncharacterized damage-inducible protein DinB